MFSGQSTGETILSEFKPSGVVLHTPFVTKIPGFHIEQYIKGFIVNLKIYILV